MQLQVKWMKGGKCGGDNINEIKALLEIKGDESIDSFNLINRQS